MRYEAVGMSNGVSGRTDEKYPVMGSRITVVREELQSEVAVLGKVVDEIAQRFSNVLRPGRDRAAGGPGVDPRMPQSPMANSLDELLASVRGVRLDLQDLLDRYDG